MSVYRNLHFNSHDQQRSHFPYIATFYKTVGITSAGFSFTGKGIIIFLILYVLDLCNNVLFHQFTLLACQSYSHPYKQLYHYCFKMLLNSCNMCSGGKNIHFIYDAVKLYRISCE